MLSTWVGSSGLAVEAALPSEADPEPGGNMREVGMLAQGEGWLWLGNALYWTNSAGGLWNEITPQMAEGGTILDVHFQDAQRGWVVWMAAVDEDEVLVELSATEDGGNIWRADEVARLHPAQYNEAVERLATLGLTNADKTGSVVYYDMEQYGTEINCRNAVNAFMNGWVAQLHARGNTAGVYGSTFCNTGLSDFQTITNVPDVIWPARWYHNYGYGYYDPLASVWTLGPCIPTSSWANHQRIRQYEGGNDENWGGVTHNIDNDVLDGVVAYFNPSNPIFGVTRTGNGSGTVTSNPAGINCGTTCSAFFTLAQSVTLSASAGAGSTFLGWSGAGCSGTGTCTVTLDAARFVSANFLVTCALQTDGLPILPDLAVYGS